MFHVGPVSEETSRNETAICLLPVELGVRKRKSPYCLSMRFPNIPAAACRSYVLDSVGRKPAVWTGMSLEEAQFPQFAKSSQ